MSPVVPVLRSAEGRQDQPRRDMNSYLRLRAGQELIILDSGFLDFTIGASGTMIGNRTPTAYEQPFEQGFEQNVPAAHGKELEFTRTRMRP